MKKLNLNIITLCTILLCSCSSNKQLDCKLRIPDKSELIAIDTLLRYKDMDSFEIIDRYVHNDTFMMCYPDIKKKFELAVKYRDTLIDLLEPYYRTLSRYSIVDLNFIVFYEDMKKFMINNSLDSAHKYDLGSYSSLLYSHLKLKEKKSIIELELMSKLEIYKKRIWDIQISAIFEVFHWGLNDTMRSILVKTYDHKLNKNRYWIYEEEYIREIGVL